MYNRQRPFLPLVFSAIAAIACNLPRTISQSAPEPAVTIIVPTETPQLGLTERESVEEAATPAPTVPAVVIPADWAQFQSDSLSLVVAVPPGWEAQPISTEKLDVRQQNSDAWLEINVVDGGNADEWSLVYQPNSTAAAVLEQLTSALQQDGDYQAPSTLPTRSGDATIVEGYDNLFASELLVGVLTRNDSWLLILGHGTTIPEDWAELLPLYQQMIASVELQ